MGREKWAYHVLGQQKKSIVLNVEGWRVQNAKKTLVIIET
jgi:hypothetical protein